VPDAPPPPPFPLWLAPLLKSCGRLWVCPLRRATLGQNNPIQKPFFSLFPVPQFRFLKTTTLSHWIALPQCRMTWAPGCDPNNMAYVVEREHLARKSWSFFFGQSPLVASFDAGRMCPPRGFLCVGNSEHLLVFTSEGLWAFYSPCVIGVGAHGNHLGGKLHNWPQQSKKKKVVHNRGEKLGGTLAKRGPILPCHKGINGPVRNFSSHSLSKGG